MNFRLHLRHFLALMVFLSMGSIAYSQVPVLVGPSPKTQFLDNTGIPLSGGIVCTYASGTSTPQATYTDSTGSTPNANPIVLDAGGRANIWWTAQAYKVVLAGGGTCGSPSNLIWSVDGFSVGLFAAGNNTFSGNNIFNGTSTFNGPVIINNGGTFNGTFSGSPNFSGSVTFSGSIAISQLTLTIATGNPPLIVTSTTVVPNLNVEIINGVAYPASPSLHSVPVITATNTATYKVVPNCVAANQGLQFTQSTNAFSCGSQIVATPTVVMKTGSKGGNYTISAVTPTDIDNVNLTYTVTVPIGYVMTIAISGGLNTSGAAVPIIYLAMDASVVNFIEVGGVATARAIALNYVFIGDGVSHTFTLQQELTGGGSAIMFNQTNQFTTMVFFQTPTL